MESGHFDMNIAIIQVAVPETLISAHTKAFLWFPKDIWKEVVWTSRRGRRLPKSLDHLETTDLLIGNILSGKHSKYEAMANFRDIKESDLVHVMIDGEEKAGYSMGHSNIEVPECVRGGVLG